MWPSSFNPGTKNKGIEGHKWFGLLYSCLSKFRLFPRPNESLYSAAKFLPGSFSPLWGLLIQRMGGGGDKSDLKIKIVLSWRYSSVVQPLSSMHETLGVIPSTTK